MKLCIAENIRNYRRDMKLTQEQLAEAIGVTVGAVSKWESGANTPDISLIAELADFFEVSIDALLGYDMQKSGIENIKKSITDMAMDRKFDEVMGEMDKALAKYPNNFEIVRLCANTYCLIGVELSDDSAHRKQLALYEKALTLISQNTDPDFCEWSIKNRIAEAHVCLGESEKALEIMKANNAQGVNDCNIAAVLIENMGRYDEGLEHMYSDLVHSVSHIMNDAVTGMMALIDLGRPNDAEQLINWALVMYEGLAATGKVCHIQRGSGRMRLFSACAALADGRYADAVAYLARAKALFSEYMNNPDNSFSGTWIRNGDKYHSFDDLGDNVFSGARVKLEKLQNRLAKAKDVLPNFNNGGKTLPDMWDEVG
ncbi:MAG: helix-turn-helix domain-containing protein [Clostridia bacterium]|nr:helix-turn-helix domain-containing protein [Clostridia bacterium]